jgi:hypothetical protein
MPQVLIVNEHTILKRDFERIYQAAPKNVYIIRQRSAWNNGDIFKQIIKLLGKILEPYRGVMLPILYFDAAKCHLGAEIFKECRRQFIHPILIPARMTFLLQPCDTHAFQSYKRVLREEYDGLRMRLPNHDIPIGEFMLALYKTIRRVLQGHVWFYAFQDNGFDVDQSAVSSSICKKLGWDSIAAVTSAKPSILDLQTVFPKKCVVPYDAIFMNPSHRPRLAPALRLRASTSILPASRPVTRSQTASQRATSSGAAAGSSSVAAPEAVASPLPWTPPPRPRRVLPAWMGSRP